MANGNGGNVSVLLSSRDGTFQPAVNYAAGSNASAVTVGDFNGDGKPDLAVSDLVSGNVSVLLGNGDGTFQAAVNYGAGSKVPPRAAVGDFNGDGKLDLAVPQGNIPGGVSVLLGNGDGTFQSAVNSPGFTLNSVVMGDFNGDGHADLVGPGPGGNVKVCC